ncbi:MAG: alpha/beta hydrolase [Oscillospiraceae bacterium]|nr:alpha/beta hydrolase [Oscillospiraceae bacterium]
MYYIHSTDNAKIAVYDLNPRMHKTILLVHGWPLSHKMFEYQKNVLVHMGYRVVSIDIRGFGNSDETVLGYDYDQLATDLYEVIVALNLNNIILAGFSVGGAIVTRYMRKYNGHGVSKLCLLSAAVPSFTKNTNNPYAAFTKEEINKLLMDIYKDRPKLNEYFGSLFFAQEHSKPLTNWFGRIADSASSSGQIGVLISLRDEILFEDMKHIHVPTGIFHGKLDKICPYELSRNTKRIY